MAPLRNTEGLVTLLAADLDAHRGCEFVDLVALLLLLHAQRADALVAVPLPGALQLRVAGLVDPLVEEAVQVAAGGFLDGAGQIAGFHRAACVALGIEPDGAPEDRVAELLPEHVQHAAALLVEMAVEKVDGLLELAAHDGPLVLAGLVEVAVEIPEQLDVGLVAAVRMGAPDVFEIRGEALVEPGLGPFAAGEEVTPPLVRQLVRHQVLDVLIEGGALVEHGLAGERGCGGVLHAAEDEIRDEDLAVARERVTHADGLAEEVDDGRRGPQAALDVGLAALRPVVVHLDAGLGRACLDLGEPPAHQGHQVRRVGNLQGVVPEHAPVAQIALLAQIAVRQYEEPGGRRAQHFAGRFHERRVHAGEIETRILVLALRPALERPAGMRLVRSHEVEPAHRRAGVGHGEPERLSPPVGASELDAQALAVVVGGWRRGVVDGDGGDGHVHGVQLDRG